MEYDVTDWFEESNHEAILAVPGAWQGGELILNWYH